MYPLLPLIPPAPSSSPPNPLVMQGLRSAVFILFPSMSRDKSAECGKFTRSLVPVILDFLAFYSVTSAFLVFVSLYDYD